MPSPIADAFSLAQALYGEGRAAEAEVLCRRIVEIVPGHDQAHLLLGRIALAAGRRQEAIAACRQAIGLAPDEAEAHFTLGLALRGAADPDAIAACYGRAIALRPDFAAAHNNLGMTLREAGRLAEAEECFRRAVAVAPDFYQARCNLGAVLQDRGALVEAEACFRHVIARVPDHADAVSDLGTVLQAQGRLAEAVACFRQALDLEPGETRRHFNLGCGLLDQGQPTPAAEAFQAALAIDPAHIDALVNLGMAWRQLGRLGAALEATRRALALAPGRVDALSNLAQIHLALGDTGGALTLHRQAVAADPGHAGAHGNLIFALPYDPATTGADLLAECRRWEARHAVPRETSHANPSDPERRLRIGYVSPDFREHPMAYFLDPWLTSHDRELFEVFCYANQRSEDAVTARLRALADHWRPIHSLSDEAAAAAITADGIDILVDLAGHTSGNRLSLFARRPAPVQVGTILGNACTTGLRAIDYILGDPCSTPPGCEAHFAETLVRLPRVVAPFAPRTSWPAVAPPRTGGPPVFACVADPARIGRSILPLWRRLLERVPGSRLVIKHAVLGEEEAVRHWRAALAPLGEAPLSDALNLEGTPGGWGAHMEAFYGRIDVVLDAFPVTGVTSTFIPLWMGVPVVTLAGHHAAQRWGSVAALTHLGLTNLIASDAEAWLAAAATLAGDRPRLADLRRTLRPTMAASALCDAVGVTRDIEAALRTMWRTWCERRT
ncbi:MAG: tetratricopeptide repeat protein [Alphaproteobacteria bacterium]